MGLHTRVVFVSAAALATLGCAGSSHGIAYDSFVHAGEPAAGGRRGASEAELTAQERELEREARLDAILRLALRRNADVLELKERVHEAVDRVPAAGRMPDLELKYEQWGVPLRRPYALDESDTVMVGVRQSFPAPGSLDAQERAAAEGARVALYGLRTRQLELIARVRRAFYDYYLADREHRIHLEHLQLAERTLDLARSSFGAGGAAQQDVLRTELEVRGLHRDVIAVEQRRRSSAALLNALMGRLADAPLGPAAEVQAGEIRTSVQELERLADAHRPELAAAAHAIERSQAEIDRANSEANWPSFMLGADYMYMPMVHTPHSYGAMASMTLPWLNGRRDDEVRAAERSRVADLHARDSTRIAVRFEVRDAVARHEAAVKSYRVVRDALLASAQRNFEAAQASFAAGQQSGLAVLDALRSLLVVRLEEVRALADLASSAAELERAAGTDLERTPIESGRARP